MAKATPVATKTEKKRETKKAMIISQELFDESVAENIEVFELSKDEAVKETIEQFLKSGYSLHHLVLTLPENGLDQREERSLFLAALQELDAHVQPDGTVDVDDNDVTRMDQIQKACASKDDCFIYLTLLDAYDGIYTIMSYVNIIQDQDQINDSSTRLLLATLKTLGTILTPTHPSGRELQNDLRDKVGPILQPIVKLLRLYEHDTAIALHLLKASHASCRINEPNKREWMQGRQGAALLLRILPCKDHALLFSGCQLITVLCRFDDFRSTTHGITTSSAQDHVLEFGRQGAIPVLKFEVDRILLEPTIDVDLLAVLLSAQRVLCIHDDIVQSMVAVGMLSTAKQVFAVSQRNILLTTATLGLVRNLCANDDVKCSLCVGESSVLKEVLSAMADSPEEGTLQEHGCGTLAAMALRKPRNALVIVQEMGPSLILSAMQHHSTNVVLLRQGALAIRNLISRADQTVKDHILDMGAEQILRQVGEHQACVDEAYAALRDLGCSVGRTIVHADGTISTKPQMFGEVKAQFRPLYED
jgi:armadillo repeat-containing protein 6